jgi:predicted dehydrogenase
MATKLPIGIVGLNFGQHILSQLRSAPQALEHFEIAAICDLDAAKVDQFSKQYEVTGYTDLDALLKNPDIPVIGLFTAPKGRAKLLRTIIQAGKDVITTKPFELNAEDACTILKEAKACGRIIHLNSPSPKPNAFMLQIKAWEKEYALGRPIYCRGEATVAYREQADGSWMDDPLSCPAAPIFRLGIYLINDLARLFGGIASVSVNSTRVFTERPTADNAALSLTFRNGAIGNIFASFCIENGHQYANSLILHYENGTITRNLDPMGYGIASQRTQLRLITVDKDQQQIIHEVELEDASGSYAWQDLYQAVQSRDLESMPIADIVHGVEVIEAMTLAQESKATVNIEPQHA